MIPNTNLTILSTTIRQDAAGRYCLNDCHKASGSKAKNRPGLWLENDKTKEFLEVLKHKSDAGNPASPVSAVRNGPYQDRGTFACKEAVYHYAMWISPEFSLTVIRAFDDMVQGKIKPAFQIPQTLSSALALASEQAAQLEIARPKADAFDELANIEGLFTLRDSAKLCGWPERIFIKHLTMPPVKWLYVQSSSGRKRAYASAIQAGHIEVKEVTIFHQTTGRETHGQPMITQKGLAKLRLILGTFPGTSNMKASAKGEVA